MIREKYRAEVIAEFGPQAGRLVLEQYPLNPNAPVAETLAAIQTDSSFACSARLADQLLSSVGVPVFRI